MAVLSTMADTTDGEVTSRVGEAITKKIRVQTSDGDMKQAQETNSMEQLSKCAEFLQPQPNKQLMKNPDGFCQLTIEAIDKIKANPLQITTANLFFLEWSSSKEWACDFAANVTPEVRNWILQGPHKDLSGLERVDFGSASRGWGVYFYLCMGIMKGYTGSGTSLDGLGGIRSRLAHRANLTKKSANTKFERYLVSNPNEKVQIVQLMETRIRSPDDDPYAPMDEVPCVYHATVKDLSQEEMNRLRFLTVLGENILMMLTGTMENPSLNHCPWKHRTWGGFNQVWALRGAVKDVGLTSFDGIDFQTRTRARKAIIKATDPVRYRETRDYENAKVAEKKAEDPEAHQANLDARNVAYAAKQVEDPAAHRDHLDQRNAKYAALKTTDPDGLRARKDRENEHYNAQYKKQKLEDPVGHRARLDKQNIRRRTHGLGAAGKKNGSTVTDYFKTTKVETNPGTDLTVSKHLAKK